MFLVILLTGVLLCTGIMQNYYGKDCQWKQNRCHCVMIHSVVLCLNNMYHTQTHSELSNLWEIGKKLWKHEFSTIYELVKNFHWPDYLVPLVSALVGELM